MQVFQVLELALDEFELLVLGNLLGINPGNLLRELINLLAELFLLALDGTEARRKQRILSRHDGSKPRLGLAPGNFVRIDNFRCLVALCLESCTLGEGLVQRTLDDGELRLGFGVVENDQRLANLDAVTIFHADLANNATILVLDLLGEGFDHDGGGCDDRPVQLGENRPAAHHAKHDHEGGKAHELEAAQRCARDNGFHDLTGLQLVGL